MGAMSATTFWWLVCDMSANLLVEALGAFAANMDSFFAEHGHALFA